MGQTPTQRIARHLAFFAHVNGYYTTMLISTPALYVSCSELLAGLSASCSKLSADYRRFVGIMFKVVGGLSAVCRQGCANAAHAQRQSRAVRSALGIYHIALVGVSRTSEPERQKA